MTDISSRQHLREKRIRLHMGASEVAKSLHVSISSVTGWERGITDLCFVPDFFNIYSQFLLDCEEGKVKYKKNARAGQGIHPCNTSNVQDAQIPLFAPLEHQHQSKEVNHPVLSSGNIEVIDFIDAHNLNFNLGNVVQYVSKAGRKDGEDTLTALKKAQWYLKREIHRLEGNK